MDVRSKPVRGRMRAEWHVTCGECSETEYLDGPDAARIGGRANLAKHQGWKLTKERGWICPTCAARV